jgi:hypothetical protein
MNEQETWNQAMAVNAMTPRDQGAWLATLMGRVVIDRGREYVYPRADARGDMSACAYVRDGLPSCLIGAMANLAGATVASLKVCDEVGADPARVFQKLGINLDRSVARHLDYVQGRQDIGRPYGMVLDGFRAGVATL